MLDLCPHCKAALGWMDELCAQDAAYRSIEVEKIEERQNPEIADKYDYYYVPSYYIDEEKVHEGVASFEIVKRVFDAALER